MSSKIGEYSEGHLLNVAKDVVKKKTKDSVVLDKDAESRIPKFEKDGKKSRGIGSATQSSISSDICFCRFPFRADDWPSSRAWWILRS